MTCALLDITEIYRVHLLVCASARFYQRGGPLLKNCNVEVVTSIAKTMKKESNISRLLEKDVLATDIPFGV
jgi:hypothetical protein